MKAVPQTKSGPAGAMDGAYASQSRLARPMGAHQVLPLTDFPVEHGPSSIHEERSDKAVSPTAKANQEPQQVAAVPLEQTFDNRSFEKSFPVLMDVLADFKKRTDFDTFQQNLKWASDDELNGGTRIFYCTKIAKIIKEVDKEITGVLGALWVNLKAQSD